MRGTYDYAPMKLMLGRIAKNKDLNPKSSSPNDDVIAFIEGDYM